jgi:hypothetical protein
MMSAVPLKADIKREVRNVRFMPGADIDRWLSGFSCTPFFQPNTGSAAILIDKLDRAVRTGECSSILIWPRLENGVRTALNAFAAAMFALDQKWT